MFHKCPLRGSCGPGTRLPTGNAVGNKVDQVPGPVQLWVWADGPKDSPGGEYIYI